MSNEIKPSYPFETEDNFYVLWRDNDFAIATGFDKNKEQIVAMRWLKNIDGNGNVDVGYPYKGDTSLWIKIPDYMEVDFLNIITELLNADVTRIIEIKQKLEMKQSNVIDKTDKENSQYKNFNLIINEPLKDKFMIIFDDSKFIVAIGAIGFSDFNKKLTIAIRWKVDIGESYEDGLGYPYQEFDNELIRIWVPLPYYDDLYLEFFRMLIKHDNKNQIKFADEIEQKVK
ncbi:hypothetical protein OFO03_00135 [Campylobacter sp. JMF_02 ED1]|uniref:hypothetical protein n=1 Tax=unclassified Campylobacter TaxID=2593542 RepID=UPI0022E9B3F4|nr:MULTISPECIES: hypothetical protein [unclassified Campylobacter]MDA3048972.1 hypothetical protein [Campylobacter sp. JMF_15 NE4]MDA3050317.1 hypothetical protein [Campylobacter sp. JMF_02 ED1]